MRLHAEQEHCDVGEVEAVTISETPGDAGSRQSCRDTVGDATDLPDLGGGAFQEERGMLTVLDEHRGILILHITGGSDPHRKAAHAMRGPSPLPSVNAAEHAGARATDGPPSRSAPPSGGRG